MQLGRRRSESNFYESFSDLIFCALVLFVALVMVLAANVGVQVDSLQDAQTQLAAAQTDVDASRQQLESIVNTHRYTGASSQPTFTLAIDVRTDASKVFFVPMSFFHRYTVDIINETEEQSVERRRAALLEITACIERQRGYSIENFSQIVRAFSYYSSGRLAIPWLGCEVSEQEQSLVIHRAYPYSSLAGIAPGSKLLSVNGTRIPDTATLTEILSRATPEQGSARVRIEENGLETERDATLIFDAFGHMSYTTSAIFHAIASGWRLADQGLEFLPPVSTFGGLLESSNKSLEQVCFDGNQIVNSLSSLDLGVEDMQEPVTTMRIQLAEEESRKRILLGSLPMRIKDALVMLQSIGNGNVAIQFVDGKGERLQQVPEWLESELLNPSGFVNRTPDLAGLKKWLEDSARRSEESAVMESDEDEA
jgi:hypothetical protein